MGAQDVHLDFHTPPELYLSISSYGVLYAAIFFTLLWSVGVFKFCFKDIFVAIFFVYGLLYHVVCTRQNCCFVTSQTAYAAHSKAVIL